MKDWTYAENLDEGKSIGTQWIVLYVNGNSVTYFDSLVVEYIPKEIRRVIGKKNIITNVFRMQTYNSIMCGDFVLDSLTLCSEIKT